MNSHRMEESALPAVGPGAVALGAFFLSGALALGYEVCWIRMASLVFGSTSYALSTVLAVFFGGLALGGWWFGRWSRTLQRPLLVYAVLEGLLALLVWLSPVTFMLADKVYGLLFPFVGESFAGMTAVRFALVALVVLPPSVLMGGTLPLFCRHFVREVSGATRWIGWLYAINTLGAALGAGLCGFVLIPGIGIRAVLGVGGLLNLLLAVGVWKYFAARASGCVEAAVERPAVESDSAPSEEEARHFRGVERVIAALFFITGFAALANEVLWSRFLSLIVHNSVYTYALMLTVMLAGLVVGSVVTSVGFGRTSRPALVFGVTQILAGLSVLYVLTRPPEFWQRWVDASDPGAQLSLVGWMLFPPALLSGMAFPLATGMVVRQVREVGSRVGVMIAINTTGGIAGSLIVGFWLLPEQGIHFTLLLVSGISVAAGLLAVVMLARETHWMIRAGLVVAGGALWLTTAAIQKHRLPGAFLANDGRLIDFVEGVNSFVAVVEKSGPVQLEVDRLWQGIDRRTHQIMSAHIPAILHGAAREVAVVGLGPGQTAGRFLYHDLERLDCIEIEGAMIPLVKRHFSSGWMDEPGVNIIIDDGRNFLAHTRNTYDIISIEVGQTWRPGVASFYTREFYERAGKRLKPGGVICQFVPINFLKPEEFRVLVRTFQDAFPESVLWYNTIELLLIGSAGEPIEFGEAAFRKALAHPRVAADLQFAHWGGEAFELNRYPNLLGGFLCGPEALKQLCGDAGIYRDNRPWLEYRTLELTPTEPVTRLIESHLSPVSSIAGNELSRGTVQAAVRVRELNLNSMKANPLKGRGLEAAREGKLNLGLERLAEALKLNPEDVSIRLAIGDLLMDLRDVDNAMVQYREVVSRAPDLVEAHNNLGTAMASAGRLEDAIPHFQAAANLDPGLVSAFFNLGRALLSTGRAEEAVPVLEHAAKLAPNDPEIAGLLDRARTAAGR